jgi:hypothetical protein
MEGPAIGHLDASLLVIFLTSRKLLYGSRFPSRCSVVLTQLSKFQFAKIFLPVWEKRFLLNWGIQWELGNKNPANIDSSNYLSPFCSLYLQNGPTGRRNVVKNGWMEVKKFKDICLYYIEGIGSMAFCVKIPFNLVLYNLGFGGTYCLYFQEK